jgi:ABC-type uncharacterized transport system substrate-binding protein
MHRIAVLTNARERDPEYRARVLAFHEGLSDLGWEEGKNVHIEFWYSEGEPQRLKTLAAEIVSSKPDVIHCIGTPPTLAAKGMTRAIPIVFVAVFDPVAIGIVSSLARPGGNLTGFANYEYSIGAKWLALLKEVAPKVKRVLVIADPANPGRIGFTEAIQSAADAIGVTITPAEIHEESNIAHDINNFAVGADGAIIALPDGAVNSRRAQIIAAAAEHRTPAIYPARNYVLSGGLMF